MPERGRDDRAIHHKPLPADRRLRLRQSQRPNDPRLYIVVGIHDKALSQRLQMDSELTLEKAKTLSRQKVEPLYNKPLASV